MIAKITKGRALKSLAQYLLHGSANEHPNRGKVLATNFAGADIRSWSREFAAFRKLKPNLSRAIAHISLNLSPDDRHVDDEEFIAIANCFKAGLGYSDDCPFVLVRHADCEHQHVHLMLSRISLDGVVPETNDFRKAEKLAAALRKEFGLKGPADKKKNTSPEEEDMSTNPQAPDKRTAAITARLEEASQESEATLASVAEPDAPSIEPYQPLTVKQDREVRREIQTTEYQRALSDLFVEHFRYLRKSSKAITVYFKDGGRIYDAGNRVAAYDTPDPAIAAQRLLDVVALKGWDSGFVVRGSDELIRQAAIIAIRKNLPMVAIDAHQLAIITSVREAEELAPCIEAAPAVLPPKRPALPSRQLSGLNGFGKRLEEMRNEEAEDESPVDNRPLAPRRPRM